MEFHKRLKELRTAKGLTQKQVAQAIGVTERNYQRFEHGDGKPNYDNLLELARYFQISLDELTGFEL